jgi:chromosome segregation ATPase
MMKKMLFFSAALLLFVGVNGQSAQTTSVQVGPVTAPAFTITINKDVKLVQNAMNQRLKEADLKTKKSEGYVACLDQLFAEIATVPINLYTKVEKESKGVAVVTVCVIPTDLTVDRETIQNNTRSFIEGFVKYVNRHEARENMEQQMENQKKAQKKVESAVSDVAKIEKNIKGYQEDIADKQKDIEKYREKIADCEKDIQKLQENIKKSEQKKADAEKEVEKARENLNEVTKEVDKYRQLAE